MPESDKIQVTDANAAVLTAAFLNTIVQQNKLIIQQLGNINMKLERPAIDLGGADGKPNDGQ